MNCYPKIRQFEAFDESQQYHGLCNLIWSYAVRLSIMSMKNGSTNYLNPHKCFSRGVNWIWHIFKKQLILRLYKKVEANSVDDKILFVSSMIFSHKYRYDMINWIYHLYDIQYFHNWCQKSNPDLGRVTIKDPSLKLILNWNIRNLLANNLFLNCPIIFKFCT